jgi:hypothetical protein
MQASPSVAAIGCSIILPSSRGFGIHTHLPFYKLVARLDCLLLPLLYTYDVALFGYDLKVLSHYWALRPARIVYVLLRPSTRLSKDYTRSPHPFHMAASLDLAAESLEDWDNSDGDKIFDIRPTVRSQSLHIYPYTYLPLTVYRSGDDPLLGRKERNVVMSVYRS